MKKIKKIQFLNYYFNGPYGKYSYGYINLGMLCACFFDEDISTDNNSNEDMNIYFDSNQKFLLKKIWVSCGYWDAESYKRITFRKIF